MKHLSLFFLTMALLLFNTAFGPAVHSAAQAQSSPIGISPETLEERYKTIWDSVAGPGVKVVPAMIVHLGASAGNRIAVWVKSQHSRGPVARDWVLNCGATDTVSVKEEVHDPQFGVSNLSITRNDDNAASLLCSLSMGGSTAQLVVPILRPLPDQKPFSFLAHSCNEPFSTKDRKGILARDLSLWLRMDARASGENSREQIPFRPQFVLGVGDQIYVDPDPDGKQPLSFFKGKRSNKFLIQNNRDSLFRALDVVYRYNFSLPPLADALSKLPSYMMWDDHEIRDGWGSQGDESKELMKAYFRVARHAFIAHQLLRSFPPGEMDNEKYKALVDGSDTLHLPFSHGERTHMLMLDSRSTRGRAEIFEDTARQAVRDWLARGRKGQGDLYVLTVGVPLFPSRTITSGGGSELNDDLQDSWDSKRNEKSRAELLGMLANHFGVEDKDRLLVISGDVHYSSLYFISLNNRVVGHEVVTSGIANSLPLVARKLNWLLDSAKPAGQFQVYAGGKINESASFAEIVVEPRALDQSPKVELVFHLNGTRAARGWRGWQDAWPLGNTNLIDTKNQTLWYHRYRYDYQDPLEHLAAAGGEADPVGAIPAGAIMSLPLEFPRVRTEGSGILWLWQSQKVLSAIQAQSIFCSVSSTNYNTTVADSWDLKKLRSICLRLKR